MMEDAYDFLKKIYISEKFNRVLVEFQQTINEIGKKQTDLSNEQLGQLVGTFEQFNLVLSDLLKEEQ